MPKGGTSKTWWQLVSSRLTARRKVGVSCWASPVTHPEWVAITRIPRPPSRRPFRRPPPVVHHRDRRRGRRGMRAGAEGAAFMIGAGAAGGWRGCARRYLPVARVGWHNALRVACAGGPFRRPPPAVRRRDRPRADGDARRAEGASRICESLAGGAHHLPSASGQKPSDDPQKVGEGWPTISSESNSPLRGRTATSMHFLSALK